MSIIIKICLNCEKEFEARISEHNRGDAKFCSLTCFRKHRSKHAIPPQPNLICAQCNTRLYRNPSKQKKSKSGFFFCSRACKDKAQRIGGIKEIQPTHYGTGKGINNYREIAFDAYEHECANCGYNDHKEALDVHHINHDRSDNRIENLVILCVICHRLIHRGIDI